MGTSARLYQNRKQVKLWNWKIVWLSHFLWSFWFLWSCLLYTSLVRRLRIFLSDLQRIWYLHLPSLPEEPHRRHIFWYLRGSVPVLHPDRAVWTVRLLSLIHISLSVCRCYTTLLRHTACSSSSDVYKRQSCICLDFKSMTELSCRACLKDESISR